MTGFVLAAGLGERMRPITETVPKPLLPIGRIPLIGYGLHLLAYHDIRQVTVNLHHLPKTIREAVDTGATYGVDITYRVEPELLGTGGGLKALQGELDDTLVVINSDTVIDLDLHAALAEHRARGALATMVLRPASPEHPGTIEVDGAGRIVRLLGQGALPPGVGPVRPMMFTGVHLIEPRLLEYIPPDVQTCIIRYAYTKALANGEPLWGSEATGYWADAGTPPRYFQTNADALGQRMALRHVDPLGGYALAPRRDVAEVVRMGRDVDLAAHVQVAPPALLGDDAHVGERAVVGPEAVVGRRVHIGREAEVVRSILLDGARVEPGAKIADQLVGKRASLSLRPG